MIQDDIKAIERLHEIGGTTTTGLNIVWNNLSGPATIDWESRIHYVAKAKTWWEAVERSYGMAHVSLGSTMTRDVTQ